MADGEIGLTSAKALDYQARLARNEKITRGSMWKIVKALLDEREHSLILKSEIAVLKTQIVAKDHELYLASTQIKALNEATALLAGRGILTGGSIHTLTFEDAPNPKHGDVHAWPEPGVPSCDWGGCMNEGAFARYDAQGGYGWLPVCESCAKKPV